MQPDRFVTFCWEFVAFLGERFFMQNSVPAHVQRNGLESPREEAWFDRVLRTYAAFCKTCSDDALRARLASAIDTALTVWVNGTELSAEHLASIEEWLMRGGPDFEVARALVELFEQIEAGGQSALIVSLGTSLNRLQRRILERWAGEMRQFNPSDSLARGIDAVLGATSAGRALTANDRDVLEAFAIGEGPRGRALCCALKVHGRQVNNDREAHPEPRATEAINVSDLSALPETDRAVIARLDAALHGVLPTPGSDEAAAVATMNRFVDKLRRAEADQPAEKDPGPKCPSDMPDDAFRNRLEYYTGQLEQAIRSERGKRGARIVNAHKFDRALIELMQYVHGQLSPSMAHIAIAAFTRSIFEGHGLVSYENPS